MSDARRPSVYDLLMAIKPDDLTENAWARRAEVSRSFFQDVKNGAVPRASTLEKVVRAAGYTMAQFYDLPGAVAAAPIEPRPPQSRQAALPFLGATDMLDVPLLGTAQGSDMEVRDDGSIAFIERMDLSLHNVVDYVRRPPALANRRDVYAITVVGNSMASPVSRFNEGAPAYVDPKRQPRPGDFVVVQLRGDDGELTLALLKQLVRRTSTHIELEQSNPPVRFKLPLNEVAAVHRVIPWEEIVFF